MRNAPQTRAFILQYAQKDKWLRGEEGRKKAAGRASFGPQQMGRGCNTMRLSTLENNRSR
jgi:hypothetical protein